MFFCDKNEFHFLLIKCFFFFFLYWDLLHARLNSHYKAWSYKKKKHKKIQAHRKSIQKEPTVKRCLSLGCLPWGHPTKPLTEANTKETKSFDKNRCRQNCLDKSLYSNAHYDHKASVKSQLTMPIFSFTGYNLTVIYKT